MKIILLLSGGIDSTVLLAEAIAQHHDVSCIGFSYGQKHVKELGYARRAAIVYNKPYREVNLDHVFGGQSRLLGGTGSVVVDNRNAVLLNIACAIAASEKRTEVWYAANWNDFTDFPDCRENWIISQNQCLKLAEVKTRIVAPYLFMTKREIVARGRYLCVDLDQTWSCYEGGETPCGECPACQLREEALCGR